MKERLQKLMAGAGLASRRAAEKMIEEGRVMVNGKTATLGMSADPAVDKILVDGEALPKPTAHRYIMLNKPKGYVTTMSDDRGRPTVAELTRNAGGRLYPVGRLDMDSEGLLILTDDGDFANRMMHPSHGVDKLYKVNVQGADIHGAIRRMSAMRELDGEPIAQPKVTLIERGGDGAEIHVVIHEGKNRQVRRMCAACGLHVSRLVRLAEGTLVLGELPAGSWRPLTKEEVKSCMMTDKKSK